MKSPLLTPSIVHSREPQSMTNPEFPMIRLLLVDAQSLIRRGLKAMLELEPDLQVVGDVENGKIALELVAAVQPDVVLMDIRMPEMDGRVATQRITQSFPNVKVLVLSTYDDDAYIAATMRAGARGYLLKDMSSKELADAIRVVHQGYTQFAPGIFDKLSVADPVASVIDTTSPKLSELTAREQEVLSLLGIGATNREIAQKLYITEGTVKSHVTSILNRLSLRNRSQLAIYANSIFNSGDLAEFLIAPDLKVKQ